MDIDQRLTSLAIVLADMANNHMGDLTEAQAGMFHDMCDQFDALLRSREIPDIA